jgi:sortase A
MAQTDVPASPPAIERQRVRHSRPRERSRVHVLTVLGVVLIVAGLAILGWLAWQFWGTNWVSERRQADVASALEESWTDGQDTASTDFGRATAILHVPRFGEDYAVPVMEGSTDEVLAAGIGHMEDTADAGEVGNYVLAGHRVTHGEPFADLPEVEAGDLVYVETRTATYTYELDLGGTDLIVPFTDSWVLGDRPRNPDGGPEPPAGKGNRLITLLTCSEIFHTDNRNVVFGHLIDKSPTVQDARGG